MCLSSLPAPDSWRLNDRFSAILGKSHGENNQPSPRPQPWSHRLPPQLGLCVPALTNVFKSDSAPVCPRSEILEFAPEGGKAALGPGNGHHAGNCWGAFQRARRREAGRENGVGELLGCCCFGVCSLFSGLRVIVSLNFSDLHTWTSLMFTDDFRSGCVEPTPREKQLPWAGPAGAPRTPWSLFSAPSSFLAYCQGRGHSSEGTRGGGSQEATASAWGHSLLPQRVTSVLGVGAVDQGVWEFHRRR